MPMSWFKALEQPDEGPAAASEAPKPFSDTVYLTKFGILPPRPGATLPIGFAADDLKEIGGDDSRLSKTSLHWLAGKPAAQDKVQWLGLNCAACHTAQITYNGKPITIDGGPSLFDFQSFVEAVDKALTQTRASANPGADDKRWNRFASSVLGPTDDNPANRAALLAALDKLITWEAQTAALNRTDLRYGFGRVDAVGHIYNRILLFGGAPQPTPNASDAPVSYPHLWNITKQSQLQWDGIVRKTAIPVGVTETDFGAMGRNTGEVLGVFGEVMIKPPVPSSSGPPDLTGFLSSVDMGSLNAMEVLLTKLQPPPWPAEFPAPGNIDPANPANPHLPPDQVMAAGKALFNANCASCHTPHATYETMKTFAAMGSENLTDEWMACNAWAYTGASGALTNIPDSYVSGAPVPPVTNVSTLLTTAVKGVLVGKKFEVVKVVAENFFGVTPLPRVVGPKFQPAVPLTPKQLRLQFCMNNSDNALLAYKARPLEGIWATPPYLHNGSVPSLYYLLQPPAKRPATFAMGARVFDTMHVGYDTSPTAPGNSFTFDTSKDGNSNKGHVYGVGALTETQRLELLEYLKGLNSPTG